MKKEKLKGLFNASFIITFSVLALYAIILIFLFSWGFVNSFKSKFYFNNIDKIFPAKWGEWQWDNYLTAWNGFFYTMDNGVKTSPWEQVLWSLWYAGGASVVSVACTCMVAYVCAKFKYKFCEFIYVFVIIAMALPLMGTAPAMIVFLNKINLFDTIPGMLLMSFTFLDMYFLIFYGAFQGISNEYKEAALIDGASEWTIFFKIMLPLVFPMITTVFLIKFIERWNNYQFAYLYLPTHPTLAYSVLHVMTRSATTDTVPLKLTSSMILALPILALFIAFRNKIMGNMTVGGVKE